MTDWTLFVFIGSYPFKKGNSPPEHVLVLVDAGYGEARERYYEEKSAYPEAHGMANFTAPSKAEVWRRAVSSGYVLVTDKKDLDVDQVFASKKQSLLLVRKSIQPKIDGLYCQGPCSGYFTYVDPNQADGKSYICPDCRPKMRKKAS